MGLVLIAAGVGLLLLPGLCRSVGRRLEPRRWALMCAGAMAAGLAVAEVGLVLFSAPTALRTLGVPGLASVCERMLGGVVPGGPVAGWLALVLAATLAVRAGLGVIEGCRVRSVAYVESFLGEHRCLGDHEVVILPTQEMVAFSVAGRPSQVVLSEGLQAVLTEEQMAAVIMHEAAHIEHGHQRYLVLAAAVRSAFAPLPMVTASVRTLQTALERWADEEASRSPGVRSALREALVRLTVSTVGVDLAAFSAAETIAERLEALDSAPRRPGLGLLGLLYSPGVALGAASVAGLAVWAGELRMVIAMAGSCPL